MFIGEFNAGMVYASRHVLLGTMEVFDSIDFEMGVELRTYEANTHHVIASTIEYQGTC